MFPQEMSRMKGKEEMGLINSANAFFRESNLGPPFSLPFYLLALRKKKCGNLISDGRRGVRRTPLRFPRFSLVPCLLVSRRQKKALSFPFHSHLISKAIRSDTIDSGSEKGRVASLGEYYVKGIVGIFVALFFVRRKTQ